MWKESNMAKLLCSVFLAGLFFQANAFSISEPPNPEDSFDWVLSFFNPVDWISNIASFFNPLNWVSNIGSLLNPLNWIPDISSLLNPVNWVKNIVNLFNPFSWIPDFLNPLHYFPSLNPFNWLPDLPNPFKLIPGIGNDRCTLKVEKGPCKASKTRYYYDQNTNACMEFQYGGCKGNRNNFEQKEECEKACRGH